MDTPVTGAPCNKFYTGLIYISGKFTFGAGIHVIDKLYLSIGDNLQTSSYTLVNARITNHPVEWGGVFYQGG